MDFILHPLTKEEARVIAAWCYDPPYAFYNAENDPDDLAELLQCEELDDVYYAVVDAADTLVGFFCFYRHADRVDIGLGVRPDLDRAWDGPQLCAGGPDLRAVTVLTLPISARSGDLQRASDPCLPRSWVSARANLSAAYEWR